jgi:hypothetical protein
MDDGGGGGQSRWAGGPQYGVLVKEKILDVQPTLDSHAQ